jgi:hypothetical protein
MARGLSEQQRRLLALAYSKRCNRKAEYRLAVEARAYIERVGTIGAAMSGTPKPGPLHGPVLPPPHITHADALLALHGWRSGTQDRDWWQRRRHIPSENMKVSTSYGRRADTVVATISRDQYEVAQASTSRTLARLVERGLLERHHRYGYLLTEQGTTIAEQWATGLAEGEREGAF